MRTESQFDHRRAQQAFTLLELLVVVGIIAVLTSLTVTSFQGIVGNYHISAAGNLLSDEIQYAQQAAISRNKPVQVRLYRDKEEDTWRTVATVITAQVSDTGTTQWLTAPRRLPGAVVINSDPSRSTFFSVNDSPALDKQTESDQAPAGIRGCDYVSVEFQADGSVLPGKLMPWVLMVHDGRVSPATGAVPNNFVAVILDPRTGRSFLRQP